MGCQSWWITGMIQKTWDWDHTIRVFNGGWDKMGTKEWQYRGLKRTHSRDRILPMMFYSRYGIDMNLQTKFWCWINRGKMGIEPATYSGFKSGTMRVLPVSFPVNPTKHMLVVVQKWLQSGDDFFASPGDSVQMRLQWGPWCLNDDLSSNNREQQQHRNNFLVGAVDHSPFRFFTCSIVSNISSNSVGMSQPSLIDVFPSPDSMLGVGSLFSCTSQPKFPEIIMALASNEGTPNHQAARSPMKLPYLPDIWVEHHP